MLEPDEYRFWWQMEVSGECLLWTGWTDRKGYGRTSYRKKPWITHRLAFVLAGGVIPAGLQVMHSCDTPACCNPNHLRTGSNRDNIDDMMAKGRSLHGARHHRAKLSGEDVKQIRLVTLDWSHRFLAKLYGVKWRAIQKIRKGQRWRQVLDL